MALPLIAAGIVARAVAKKLATRAVAGITGAGAKNVAPINREMGTGSVTQIPKNSKSQFATNSLNSAVVNERKSGGFAKNAAVQMQGYYKSLGGPKKPTIKINSNTRAR